MARRRSTVSIVGLTLAVLCFVVALSLFQAQADTGESGVFLITEPSQMISR